MNKPITIMSKVTKGLPFITYPDAVIVKHLIRDLNNPKRDKRTVRIKKNRMIAWFHMISNMFAEDILTIDDVKDNVLIYNVMYTRLNYGYYVRLKIHEKLRFLSYVDNAFILLLAKIDMYIGTDGQLTPLARLHPNHFEAIAKKLQRQNYTLPQQFKPIQFKIEE